MVHEAHTKLNQWFATSICGNDILSSTFYVSGIAIIFAGVYAPLILAFIGLVLFFYKSVYTEVVEALPINGGAYNCLLNATSKSVASLAGVTTILSYVATAVISGKSAIEYLHTIVPGVPVTIATIALLAFFAALVIAGIKDSAKVAFTIFAYHVLTLTVFVILGAIYVFHGHSYLLTNLTHTNFNIHMNGGLFKALFFGFAASMLGVSGFESSANFVEEQDRGVFRKTLRNMLIGVVIFNPLIALIVLNVMPIDAIVNAKDFLLSDAAKLLAGNIFQMILVVDAFLVLAGAVLTGFVGVSGLIYRMSSDAVLPNFLTKENSKGSYPRIVVAFFLLCTSILLVTGGDLLALAGVYTIAFLSVMSMFALGNLILRETRSELKRTYHAPLMFVVLALTSTVLGIIGNINLDPKNLNYFATYFIPAIILVFGFANMDLIIKSLMRTFRKVPAIYNFLERHFEDMHEGKFIAFIHNIDRLHSILEYINKNETGWEIILIHCKNDDDNEHEKTYKELSEVIPAIKRAGVYPHFNVKLVDKREPFGPDLIEKVSKEYKIRKNRILIGSIHHFHPFDYSELGGVRIIF